LNERDRLYTCLKMCGKDERRDCGLNIESWQFLLNRRFQWRQILNLINAFDRTWWCSLEKVYAT